MTITITRQKNATPQHLQEIFKIVRGLVVGFLDDAFKPDEIKGWAKPSYPCHRCGQTFKGSTGLSKHQATCNGKMRFRCNGCVNYFETEDELNVHKIKIHEAVIEIGKLSCKTCNVAFENQGLFVNHFQKEHDIPPSKKVRENIKTVSFSTNVAEVREFEPAN